MNKWQGIPFKDLVRSYGSIKPKDVDGLAAASTGYYMDKLYRLLAGRFQLAGAPENWDIDYFFSAWLKNGMICITDTQLGVVPLECGVAGLNLYNHPTECVIGNPILGSFRRKINENCALVKLQWNYRGCMEIIERYAVMLAMCDSSIAVNLMNSKVTFIATTEDKSMAATMQTMYDKISQGEPAVFVKKDVMSKSEFFFNRVKEQYIAGDIQLLKRTIVNEFLTEIGVNNANTDKRERLNSEEVNANNSEIFCNIQHWLDNAKEGLDMANKLYGLNVFLLPRKWRDEDESSKSDRLGFNDFGRNNGSNRA